MCSHAPAYTQCQILCCYTCGSVSAGATYPCRATLWHVVTEGTCEFRYSVQFIFVGPVYHNTLTNRAALLSPRGPSLALRAIHLVSRLRRRNHMCSSRVSGTAYRQGHGSTLCSPTEEKILCRSPFRSGLVSPIFAVASKGKRKIHKKEETVGCFLLVPRRVGEFPRGVSAHSAAW